VKKDIYTAIDDETQEVLLLEKAKDGYNATVYKFFGARDEWCVHYMVFGVYNDYLAKLHVPTTAREMSVTAKALAKLEDAKVGDIEYSVFPLAVGNHAKTLQLISKKEV
jgi:hypothetical protein